ncbi:hypothetical protein [Metabacillus fastidiosus]
MNFIEIAEKAIDSEKKLLVRVLIKEDALGFKTHLDCLRGTVS